MGQSKQRAASNPNAMVTHGNPSPAEATSTVHLYAEAHARTASARAALATNALLRLNFEVTAAVQAVQAALPNIRKFRDEIAKLPVNQRQIDELETYVHAAIHAQILYTVARSPKLLESAYAEALAYRGQLRSECKNLATHGLIDGARLAELTNETGYLNVAYDVLRLVVILREAGSRILGRTATLPEDIDKAEAIAARVIELFAGRKERNSSEAANDRLRAVTLMLAAYTEARHAMAFVRFRHGDAHKLAPSIYAARRSAKRRNTSSAAPKRNLALLTKQPPESGVHNAVFEALAPEPLLP